MKKVLKNEFSWSVSRDSTFRECPRKYYFSYYGYWGGWDPSAPPRIRKIYVLKQLKNRALWIGEVVHQCIARSLQNLARGVPLLDLSEILTITRDRMRQDFRHSREGSYRQDPLAYCGLFEHEYGIEVTNEQWKNAAEQVDQCLRNFYSSIHFDRIRKLDRRDFLEIEEFSRFTLEGVPIQIKLDLACKEKDRVIIWDWKTGKGEKVSPSIQIACYAYYACQAFGVTPSDVIARQFDLYQGIVSQPSFARRSMDELLSYIRGSIKDMLGLLADPGENKAREEDFAKVEKRSPCLRCNFLRVCQPNLQKEAIPTPLVPR